MKSSASSHVSTTNPCRMCRPMGACLAFRGIANSMVLLHGSQGCSTYMRRYISSHFNEPVDIASSSLSEKSAVYGGAANLKQGIRNVVARYSPSVLGVVTTCLTETIGDDVRQIIAALLVEEPSLREVLIVPVSAPSYSGSHMDGFHDSCVAILERLASRPIPNNGAINIFPGFISPADIRHLGRILADFQTPAIILPDFSQTLDGGISDVYRRIPVGGTSLEQIGQMAGAAFSIEFNVTSPERQSSSALLESLADVSGERLPLPIGLRNCDFFFQALSDMTLTPVPARYKEERARLLDAMVDAHKYLFGKKVAVYGDADMVLALTGFMVDVGLVPVVCASSGDGAEFTRRISEATAGLETRPAVLTETDFDRIGSGAAESGAELLVGSSKGNHIARRLDIPLLRLGFPIHDRIGAQRLLHIGYQGTINLLDRLTNTIIAQQQDEYGNGYSYM